MKLDTAMRVGIDASNLRAGGGVTHLIELLRSANPQMHGFDRVIVWSGTKTLQRIEERPWLHKAHEPLLDQSLAMRSYWQRVKLSSLANVNNCDVLFVPGGTYSGSFRPFVTMSQNMLPFEELERRRYGLSWMRLKLRLLKLSQSSSFRRADGVIFLTRYAQRTVQCKIGVLDCPQALIPHGVDEQFRLQPRPQRSIDAYSSVKPFRILYVSIVDVYKHQRQVARAVAKLMQEGFPVELDLIGPDYPPALHQLQQVMTDLDPEGHFIHYRGAIPHTDLPKYYHQADLFGFASSCENMPNILLEAMAAGLPIACSNRGPMPEVLGEAGSYFDPESSDSIADSLRGLLLDVQKREQYAIAAYQRATRFTWKRCARETMEFIANTARSS